MRHVQPIAVRISHLHRVLQPVVRPWPILREHLAMVTEHLAGLDSETPSARGQGLRLHAILRGEQHNLVLSRPSRAISW